MEWVLKLFNHEVWVLCSHCKKYFDARIDGTSCPNCKNINQ